MGTMNASQSILESEELPGAEEEVHTLNDQPPENQPLRLIQSHVLEDELPTDSFKKTAPFVSVIDQPGSFYIQKSA